MDDIKNIEAMVQELRRGVIVLAVMAQLREEQYGYSLISQLGEKGMEIDQGTLYPLLRRLESQGWLDSVWKVDGARPRRYYILNSQGAKALQQLKQAWEQIARQVNINLGEEG